MSNDVAKRHPLFESVEEKQELVTTLFAGTKEMREAGSMYLPLEPGENATNYENRLARSVLFPAYKQAVKSNTGKLFVKDIVVSSATTLMTEFLTAVDENDNDLTEFAKKVTENAINNGCSYILVDYPVMGENATLQDELNMGGRPYWVNIKQSQVLEASPVKRGGRNILGVFRFKEDITIRTSIFTSTVISQIKQFQFNAEGFVEYLTFRKDSNNNWILFDQGQLITATGEAFAEIPIIDINVEPIGFYAGQPVFYDLAEENKQHWQMSSDYNNIVHHSQVPMLGLFGFGDSFDENGNKNDPIIISPNTVISIPNPDAKAGWIEVSGQASVVGEKALTSSIRRMAVMSLQLLINADSKATATAVRVDAKENLSVLQSVGKSVEQALLRAINLTYKYTGDSTTTTTIELNVDDAIVLGNNTDVPSLLQMNESGLLSNKTTLDEVQRRGVISDNVNTEEEAAKAKADMPQQL